MSALLLSLLDIFSFPHCDPQPKIIEKQYKVSYLSLFKIAACSALKLSEDSGADFFQALLYFWVSSTKFSNVYKTWDCFLPTPNRWSCSPPIFHFFMGLSSCASPFLRIFKVLLLCCTFILPRSHILFAAGWTWQTLSSCHNFLRSKQLCL